ncbi:MAG: PhzF family phenazine biosynthesis protein [Ktedonobacteraceae bacterium]
MGLTIYQVDAFTDRPFAGNPAAVCILAEPGDARWMQQVATEMNLSETAFLYKQENGFSLRWFTPVAEVELCGHATLASAHTLWEVGQLQANEQARFHTLSGLLTANHGEDGWIEMDFPAKCEEQADAPPSLLQALGVSASYVGKNVFDYLVEVGTEEEVRGMQPDMTLLAKVPVRGVMVTSRASSPRYDFVSRFFAPQVGVNEDPVTGSAHCCLAPYWSQRLGKSEMLAYQASARGGVVRVSVNGERVKLGGQAVTVMQGELIS